MKLTGKALEGYISFINEEYPEYERTYNLFQNALIIEYLDSVGVYVNALKYDGKWKMIVNTQFRFIFNSRIEAINAAIEKANEIINKL